MKTNEQKGQVMLLTVLVMSAVFLTATVIAGLLMIYQLGQVTKVVDSAKAIFAADAATDRALFKLYRCNVSGGYVVPAGWATVDVDPFCSSAANADPVGPPPIPPFLNNASYRLTIESSQPGCGNNHCPTATLNNVESIKATGHAGKSARAFEVTF